MVVDMNGGPDTVRDRWASDIARIVADRDSSFKRASEVRTLLASSRTWQQSVEGLLSELRA
jgi:hypothetical protein